MKDISDKSCRYLGNMKVKYIWDILDKSEMKMWKIALKFERNTENPRFRENVK